MQDTNSVLIIDDEPDLLDIAAFRFEEEGFKVYTAQSVSEALGILSEHSIKFILSDMKMPNGSGFDLLEEINKKSLGGMHIFLVTGSIELKIDRILDLGAEAVFRKPIDYDAIIEVIKNKLNDEQPENHRSFSRLPIELAIALDMKSHRKRTKLTSENIGRGGVFVRCDSDEELPMVDEEISLSITYVGDSDSMEEISGTGVVRWIRKLEIDGLPKGFGIQFLEFSGVSKTRLNELLNSLVTKSYIPRS